MVRSVKPEQKDLIKKFNDNPDCCESDANGKPLNVKAEAKPKPKKKAKKPKK